jgi:spore maturation protein CgeB
MKPARLVVLGLSITSSWGNGHATTYRGLLRGLAGLGYRTLFLERDVPWYANNRDNPRPAGCEVRLYDSLDELERSYADEVRHADAVIIGSYVPDGAEVSRWVLETAKGPTFFYDIDTPVTLAALKSGDADYLAATSIPEFAAYLSFTGGPALRFIERELGARRALPLFCSAEPDWLVPPETAAWRELGYLGTYSADRQPGLEELLSEPARQLPSREFVVAGPSYPKELEWPPNVVRIEHVGAREHPAFYGSLRFTLNVTRADMKRLGYSPSVRLFEAAACATPVISDRWDGIDQFFRPGTEILLADSADEVRLLLERTPEERRQAIGRRARERVLREHTGAKRAAQLDSYVQAARSTLRTAARIDVPASGIVPAPPESVRDS